MNNKHPLPSASRPASARPWQIAVAVAAFSAAALTGCDRRDGASTTSTSSSTMPAASAASR